jgi:Xaa-Pro aminopeptidase
MKWAFLQGITPPITMPWIFGYRGPTFTALAGRPPRPIIAFIEDQMMIKSPAEIALIKDIKWANLAHTLLQRYTRPGLPCAEVDRTLRASYEKHALMLYWKHHVGHAIGLRYHEAPFLDHSDETIIQPGMVFTIEPGLYATSTSQLRSGHGGYRHSDTVLVTESGAEVLTYYPRDLESLTIPG